MSENNSEFSNPNRLLQTTIKHDIGAAFAWDYALTGAMKRMVAARSVGLDADQFGKLPPGSSMTVIDQASQTTTSQSAPQPKSNWLRNAGIGAALLALGGGGAMGLNALWNRIPTPTPIATAPIVTAPVPTVPQAKQLDSDWDVVNYVLQPDGSEKILARTHYRSRSGVVESQQSDGTWKPAPTVKAP